MQRKKLFVYLILAFMLVPGVVVAQEETPVVIGEDTQGVLDVVTTYLTQPDADLLAEGVQLYTPYWQTPLEGVEEVYGYDQGFYYDTFNEVTVDPLRYIVAENVVVAEYNFSGVQVGLYRDVNPTNARVLFPALAVFSVEDGKIASIRRYYDATMIYEQLGYYRYAPTPPLMPVDFTDTESVSDILDNPDLYMNDQLIVEGTVGDMITDRAFVLWDRDLIDLDGQERMLVILKDKDVDFFPVDGGVVQVSGQVHDFVLDDIETELDYDLDDAVFGEYSGMFVVVADSVFNIGEAQTVENIVNDTEAFVGRQVTVEASVGEMVGENAFILYDDELIGVGGRVLVVGLQEGMLSDLEPQTSLAKVTGTVQEFDLMVLEEDVGYDLGEDDLFVDYQDLPVIVARDVTQIGQ